MEEGAAEARQVRRTTKELKVRAVTPCDEITGEGGEG